MDKIVDTILCKYCKKTVDKICFCDKIELYQSM